MTRAYTEIVDFIATGTTPATVISFAVSDETKRMLVPDSDQGDDAIGKLLPQINPSADCPPTFIVHTNDDASSSIGSVLLYAGLKKHGVMAELHVYENGGHGYGTRAKQDSNIGSWTDRMIDWLVRRKLADRSL